MALRLPRLMVDLSGAHPTALGRGGEELRAGELKLLVGLDQGTTSLEVDRCLWLSPGRWAVCRRKGDRTVWRLVTEAQFARVGHPAWLWTKDWWFDPRVDGDSEGPAPAPLPLRSQIRYAAGIGSARLAVKALASLVAALRADAGPVALRLAPELLASGSHPARWLMLALLTSLPPARRERLRLSVGEPEPDPDALDVAFIAQKARGFRMIDAADPPGEGEDLVAYFVHNRLLANDPEAVEAVAFVAQAGKEVDAWGEDIRRLLRLRVPGLSAPIPNGIDLDPERAVGMVVARLCAGAELDESLCSDLLAVTRKARDPRPWMALSDRPAADRERLVALLLTEKLNRPRPELVKALAAIYPDTGETEAWYSALLSWIREGVDWEAAIDALERALLKRREAAVAVRLSVWQEAIQALTDAGHPKRATQALVSPLAAELAEGGLGRPLAVTWFSIPADRRDHTLFERFVDQIAGAPGGARTTDLLRRRLHDDPTEFRAAIGHLPLDALPGFLTAATTGPQDPLWADAERIHAATLPSAYARFLAISRFSAGLPALEAEARDHLVDAIREVWFPDPEFAELCLAFAQLPGRSAVWPWMAVASATPDRFPPEILEPAVTGVTGEPPETDDLMAVAWEAAQRLGASEAWSGLEHARWLQLLCMSPEGGFPTDFGAWLAIGLAQAIAARPDGVERLAEITTSLAELGAPHPALQGFLGWVLPAVWGAAGAPARYRAAIHASNLPTEILNMWRQVVEV